MSDKPLISININEPLGDKAKNSIKIGVHEKEVYEAVAMFEDFKSEDNNVGYVILEVGCDIPEEMKDALQEFVNDGLEVAGGFFEEVTECLGEEGHRVGVLNGKAVAVIQTKVGDLSVANEFIDEAHIKEGTEGSFALQTSLSFLEFLKTPISDWNDPRIHFNFQVNLEKETREKIISKIPESEAKASLAGIVCSLANKFHATLDWNQEMFFKEHPEVNKNIVKAQTFASSQVDTVKGLYQSQSEMLENFPFVLEFIEALKRNGNGNIRVACSTRKTLVYVDIKVNDGKALYEELTGETN